MSETHWEPHEMPSLLVNWLSRVLSRQVDQRLTAVGLTGSQLPVLVALKDGRERTQKELADHAGVAQPSMAQLLARMQRDGLIQRAPSSADGRMSMISLTAEASNRLEPGRAVLRKLDEEVCSILTDDERRAATTILQKLVRHAEGLPNVSI